VSLSTGGGPGNTASRGPQLEPLLNLEQAGALLGLDRKQMFELTRERSQSRRKVRLPVVRIGKRCLFRREALQRWIEALEQEAE